MPFRCGCGLTTGCVATQERSSVVVGQAGPPLPYPAVFVGPDGVAVLNDEGVNGQASADGIHALRFNGFGLLEQIVDGIYNARAESGVAAKDDATLRSLSGSLAIGIQPVK